MLDANATYRPSADSDGLVLTSAEFWPVAPAARTSVLHVNCALHGGVQPTMALRVRSLTVVCPPIATYAPSSEMSIVFGLKAPLLRTLSTTVGLVVTRPMTEPVAAAVAP